MDRESLRVLRRSYITQGTQAQRQEPITIEVSAHHVHPCQEHTEALFGKGYQLAPRADLSQPNQFVGDKQATIVGPKGRIERVRVLGPCRNYSPVKIAIPTPFKLSVHPPVRESGHIKHTPGYMLEGPDSNVQLKRGVICNIIVT